jgi:hypothetical protein
LIDQASAALFVEDLLEAEETLWGGFWQGDVIAPGYSLPASELALLRAVRLDATWPESTSVTDFLTDLHRAMADPHAAVWTLAAAGEPCVVFASLENHRLEFGGQPSAVSRQSLATVVWYCATTNRLHAGYRTAIETLNFSGAVEQRELRDSRATPLELAQPGRLEQIVEPTEAIDGQPSAVGGHPLAVRLDAEILRLRRQR